MKNKTVTRKIIVQAMGTIRWMLHLVRLIFMLIKGGVRFSANSSPRSQRLHIASGV